MCSLADLVIPLFTIVKLVRLVIMAPTRLLARLHCGDLGGQVLPQKETETLVPLLAGEGLELRLKGWSDIVSPETEEGGVGLGEDIEGIHQHRHQLSVIQWLVALDAVESNQPLVWRHVGLGQ